MRKIIYLSTFIVFSSLHVFSQKKPPAEAFTVIKKAQVYGPSITSLLKNQTETAWKQDELRRENLKSIKNEKELLVLQQETKRKLLTMIGGLPEEKTPLRAQILDRIQMNGFH